MIHPFDGQRQLRLARAFGAADHAQALDLQRVVLFAGAAVLHQGDQVVVVDFLLGIGQRLEPHEDIRQLVVGQFEPQVPQLGPQGGAARMLAHHQIGFGQADIGGAHDLERFGVLQHAVLMDAAFMREGVLADDGLVELHGKAGHGGNLAADVHDLGAVHAGAVGHDVIAHLQRHDHLFQGGIAGALAQTVDRAFDLPRPGFHRRQRIGRRHAKVIVAMGGKGDGVGPGHPFQQHPDQVSAFARHSIAHGIGDVDRGGPGLDRNLDHAAQVIMFRPCRVHRRPLDIVAQVAGMCDGVMNPLCHLVHVQVRNGPVQRRGADEGMDARVPRMFHRVPAAVDILVIGPRQSADDRCLRLLGDVAHGGEIAFRGDGKARLDDVHAHVVQQGGNFQLFGMGHGGAGALFAVAQRRVKDQDARLRGLVGHDGLSLFLWPVPGAGHL